MRRRLPDTRWVLHEDTNWRRIQSAEHVTRLRLQLPYKTFVLRERVPK
ncbi:MAG: hypothetical protein ACI9S9_005093 [Planctomycetota bacterium]|jgi:hypothetical protein